MTKHHDDHHIYYRSSDHFVDKVKSVSVVHERGRGIAWRIWPGAHVLLDWLETHVAEWLKNPCHCVEIGAGVGLVGIVAAGLGAEKVTLTDLPEELEALKRSVASNIDSVRNRLEVLPLSFGNDKEIEEVIGAGESRNEKLVIVGSELIYWESLFEPIAHTLRKLVIQHNGVAFIGYRKRVWKTEKRFFTKILKQVGLDCQILGQWMAVEQDGASQTTDGQVVYTEAENAQLETEWNTRVYKIFRRSGDVEEAPAMVEGKQHPVSPKLDDSPPPAKDKKKPKIIHKEKKGRAR